MKDVVRIKISGLNLTRLINKLIECGVLIDNLIIKSKHIVFEIDSCNIVKLKKICKQEHKTFIIIYRNGLKNLLFRLPYLFGSILALVIIMCYLISFNLFVSDIDIVNNSDISYDISKVDSLLASNGVKIGSSKIVVEKKYIEELLLTNLEDISACTVEYNGTKLKISIFPSILKNELIESDIYSKYDAVVVEADAYAGVMSVKVGDVVKSGDLLIKFNKGASGSVKGKVYFTSTKIYNENQEIIEYTGNYQTFREFSVFEKKLVKQQNICTFSKYMVKKCDFYPFDGYVIPLSCKLIYCYEYELKDKKIPFEDVESEIKLELYQKTLDKVPIGGVVNDYSYSIVKDGMYTRVDCFIEAIVSLI